MPTDKQALAALDDIDLILGRRIGRPVAVEGRSLNQAELSAEYWEVRMRLDTALTLINKIPVYGRRIATAVRFLMQICDRHCSPPPEDARLRVAPRPETIRPAPTMKVERGVIRLP